jgi:hypothetical protein
MELTDRFLQKCSEHPCKYPELGNCWLWTGNKFLNGYGQLTKTTYGVSYAHQFSAQAFLGVSLPIQKGFCVKHKCDTKLCVNPAHLEYGTLQENIQEMIERNPKAMGRIPPSNTELEALRDLLEKNIPRREMARILGHSRHWIDRIVRDYVSDAKIVS